MSTFEKLLLKYPSAPWNWSMVSTNPSVSFEFIIEHPELPWVPKYVSRNSSVKEIHVRDNLTYPWDFDGLCVNPNMSLSFFNEYIIKPDELMNVNWELISCHPSITMIDVMSNPSYKWNDRYLSANPNLTSNFITHDGNQRDWFVPFVCANPGITATDIFKNKINSLLEKKGGWDYMNLSTNPNLPIAYVDSHLNHVWNFHPISSTASLTDIEKYRRVKWDSHGLSLNRNLTFDYVKKRSDVGWHAPALLSNSSISLADIENDMDWFKKRVSTPIQRYLSSNRTITEAWIDRNRYTLDWNLLSSNQLN